MYYPEFFKLGTTDDNHTFDIGKLQQTWMGPTRLFSPFVPVILGFFKLFFKLDLLAVPQDGHASEEVKPSERNGKKQEAEGKLGRRRERRKGLHSLLNQTCSGNSAHQRRQPVKNELICHLITYNCDSICRALYPHGFTAV